MNDGSHRVAVVFGGTGFLGRRIARQLAHSGFSVRAAVRHPARAERLGSVDGVEADVHDDASVAGAVRGADIVVNAVSLYVEKKDRPSFRSVHEEGAARVARQAAGAGAARLIHISGIGADASSTSRFISARGRGEQRVRSEFPAATVLRPSVMFGEDDSFFNSLADIMARSPVFPLIGGSTRLQPVAADDVARAAVRAADGKGAPDTTFELGGPTTVTMREIAEWLRDTLSVHRAIVPVPMPLALLQAHLLELLPNPPLTVAQVELLRRDNTAKPGAPGFDRLDVQPVSFRDAVPRYLRSV